MDTLVLTKTSAQKGPRRRPRSTDASHVLISILRAMSARTLFIVHSLVTIRYTVKVEHSESVWAFALISLLIVFEGGYAIIMRAGDERKWFCASVFLYIIGTTPAIWLLETRICRWRVDKADERDVRNLLLSDNEELNLQLLEQLVLVVVIVGRWLLPKGDISREQLSQILLAYLAISSDIVEFFDVFKEKTVYSNPQIQKIVLSAWTLSMFQFPFVLTVSRARKMRVALTNDYENLLVPARRRSLCKIFYDLDIWAIILANLLQDLPYFITRLYLMFYHNLVTYTMIFFIFKNMLIILLQTYRAIVIINDRYIHPKPPDVDLDVLEHMAGPPARKKEHKSPKYHQTAKKHEKPVKKERRKGQNQSRSRRSSRGRSISEERERLFPSHKHFRHMEILEEA